MDVRTLKKVLETLKKADAWHRAELEKHGPSGTGYDDLTFDDAVDHVQDLLDAAELWRDRKED